LTLDLRGFQSLVGEFRIAPLVCQLDASALIRGECSSRTSPALPSSSYTLWSFFLDYSS